MQVFSKACDGCKKRRMLDDENRSAAESLAKGRFIREIAEGRGDRRRRRGANRSALRTAIKITLLGYSFRVAGVMPATGTRRRRPRVRSPAHGSAARETARTSTSSRSWLAAKMRPADSIGNLRELFPDAKVVTITQVVDTQVAVNRLMTRLSYLFFAILLVVGVASIAGTMFANVTERRREIGTLMALGATPSLVARLFLGKALLIGLAGGVLGYVVRHGAGRRPGAELGRHRGRAGAVAGGASLCCSRRPSRLWPATCRPGGRR